MSTTSPMISISIVSHSQAHMLHALLTDLDQYCKTYPLEILLTLNLPETLPFNTNNFCFPVIVHTNPLPKGFSANHNHAFTKASGQYFCVMNPDIRLDEEVFTTLHTCLQDPVVGVAAPRVVNASGAIEDSARHFPTPFKILCRALGGCQGNDYIVEDETLFPDWVAGMFMIFRCEVFQQLGGFDERYFLYYEDVDLCARLRLQDFSVALCPTVKVTHHARRDSHRNIRYFKWHLFSMLKFFLSTPFLKIGWLKLTGRMS